MYLLTFSKENLNNDVDIQWEYFVRLKHVSQLLQQKDSVYNEELQE